MPFASSVPVSSYSPVLSPDRGLPYLCLLLASPPILFQKQVQQFGWSLPLTDRHKKVTPSPEALSKNLKVERAS